MFGIVVTVWLTGVLTGDKGTSFGVNFVEAVAGSNTMLSGVLLSLPLKKDLTV